MIERARGREREREGDTEGREIGYREEREREVGWYRWVSGRGSERGGM